MNIRHSGFLFSLRVMRALFVAEMINQCVLSGPRESISRVLSRLSSLLIVSTQRNVQWTCESFPRVQF